MTSHSERLTFARELAERAGKLGMEFFRKLDSLTIENKGHQDLVSEADREVELFVRREIAKTYPDDGVIGEEHAPTKGSTGYDWVIDPIDGTANFVRGIPAWCVVIACAKDGVTVTGVIHEPSTGETFYGEKGGGAFLNGRPIKTTMSNSLGDGSLGIGFSNRRETTAVPALIKDLLARGGVFYRNASGALMLAYVASGRLLGYIENHMNAWDCIAGILLVEEAGGRVITPDPATVLERGTVVVVGGAEIFDDIFALCAETFGLTPK
ncbi:inositol monophosphatase family protein [Mesorhizobium sp. YM1C-6-2]|uniref:inositol monophosphatase family protein n=1 Tax=Mesorhizobium sp. YM1C-6-2 TaxID=1827501 RepID=UPI000EF28FB0|nr:inositol monophosphatase family protein [Mesorhizobium sp. YM1C-6-2]RLP28535.1 inositol monophosphatase [Mesorhizobium sp. YM1C-6-2]